METHALGAPGPRPRRVVVTGAESTGKTTLAAALAAHYDVPWVPEYARAYAAEAAAPLTYADVAPIARGVLAAEAAAEAAGARLLLFDTDLLSTWLYSHHYYGTCPAFVAAALRAADLYVLCADDIPWTPDPGQRDGPAVRAALQPRFRAELERRAWPFVEVSGPPEVRLAAAVQAIDRLLAL